MWTKFISTPIDKPSLHIGNDILGVACFLPHANHVGAPNEPSPTRQPETLEAPGNKNRWSSYLFLLGRVSIQVRTYPDLGVY